MEARKCPDCETLTYFDKELINKDHLEDGECLVCQQCGYAIYLEDEIKHSKIKNWCALNKDFFKLLKL